MIDIRLEDVRKVYANGVWALRGVSLAVEPGQCLALVGPSGCGKTTLLRLVAGLEQPDGGTVRLGEQVVNGVPAHRRGVAMVFQRPVLLLGQSVRENLAWSWTVGQRGLGSLLRSLVGRPRRSAAQNGELVEVARLLGIEGLLDRRAGELSGGQQQRVALGRALLRRAPVCLLDEPLGHLEAALRLQLRRDLRLLSRRFPATMIHVTHDPAEALAVGGRVAVLHDGRLQQVGSPADVLHRPANRFVAAFCHSQGPLNFVEGRLHADGGEVVLAAGPWLHLVVPAAVRRHLPGDGAVTVGIEGGDAKILPDRGAAATAGPIIQMDIALTEFAPQGTWVTCRRNGIQLTGLFKGDPSALGTSAVLEISLERAMWFETSTGVTLWAPTG
jgi:multiple sugar transport system ATP-binding protein